MTIQNKSGPGYFGSLMISVIVGAVLVFSISLLKGLTNSPLNFIVHPFLSVGIGVLTLEFFKRRLVLNFRLKDHRMKVPDELKLISFLAVLSLSLFSQFISEFEEFTTLGESKYLLDFNTAVGGGSIKFLETVVSSPITEELIFRGLLLLFFIQKFSTFKSILGVSIVFSLFHIRPDYINSYSLVASAFFLSILLGVITLKSNNVLFSMVLHGLYNLVWILWLVGIVIFDINLYTTRDFVLLEVALISASIILAGFVVFLWMRYRLQNLGNFFA